MKKMIIAGAALALSPAVTIHAQRMSVGAITQGDQTVMVAKITPLEGRVVRGQAYSAEIVTESIQTLADGNRIVQRTTGRVYRDSEGRVRREEDRASGGPTVSITDPVAGTAFALDPANRTARETPGFFSIYLGEAGRLLQQLNLKLQRLQPGAVSEGAGRGARGRGRGGDAEVEEKLQDRSIEGVIASGVRRTTTIEKGAIGNEQPIKIVSEEWTSPELQLLVMTDLSDPRTGRSTYRLLKISRLDPDPTLFQVPADYTVQRMLRGGLATAGAGGDGAGGRGRRGQ